MCSLFHFNYLLKFGICFTSFDIFYTSIPSSSEYLTLNLILFYILNLLSRILISLLSCLFWALYFKIYSSFIFPSYTLLCFDFVINLPLMQCLAHFSPIGLTQSIIMLSMFTFNLFNFFIKPFHKIISTAPCLYYG